jgi:hypothetical protein
LKLIGTVVVQLPKGAESVIVTEPVPLALDVVDVTFTLKSARTGGEPVLVTLNEAGLIARGEV